MKEFLLFFLYSSITEGVFGESVSVTEGDSVTLHTGFTEIQKSDAIEWRFGDELLRIARIRKDSEPSLYEDALDGKFRGRLKLNSQAGDLKITNIKTTDTGVYEVTNSINTFKKSFSVTVVSVDQKQSVLVGQFVTLQTGLTDTKKYDVIRWKFGPQHSTIAEVNTKDGKVSPIDVPDERFTNRLQLDYQTGSLTITNIGIPHSGFYEVDIIKSSSYTIHKTFSVTVSGEVKSLSVIEGESVSLHTNTEIQNDDIMLWMFRDIVIVSQSNNKAKQQLINDGPDGIFRDILNLDHKTGSLTITNVITKHAGDYKLLISSSRRIVNKKFIVNVKDSRLSSVITAVKWVVVVLVVALAVAVAVAVAAKYYYRHKISEMKAPKCDVVSVRVTDDITLEPGVTNTTQNHDVILWVFEGTLIAGMTGDAMHSYDERFRDSLNQTGSLTIRNITTQHAGLYKVSMMIGSNASFRSFKVTVDSTASTGNGAETAILLTQQP